MGGIRFWGCGCRCQSEDPFPFLVWNPHKGLVCKFSHKTRRGRGKEGPRESREGDQSREEDRTDQSTEENKAISRREQELNLWTQSGLANVRRWVSFTSGFVGISLEYTLTLAHRSTKCEESVTDFSLLVLGANPSPWLFVLLFFYPLGCVCCGLCVHKEMWNTSGQRWEKPLDDLMAMSGFRSLRQWGPAGSVLSQF